MPLLILAELGMAEAMEIELLAAPLARIMGAPLVAFILGVIPRT